MANIEITKNVLAELQNLIDEKKLKCWLLALFHGSRIACCHCGQPLSRLAAKSFMEYRITSCVSCKKKVSFFRKTILQGAKISPRQFVLIAAFLSVGAPPGNIAKALNLSISTVKEWIVKLSEPEPTVVPPTGDDAP